MDTGPYIGFIFGDFCVKGRGGVGGNTRSILITFLVYRVTEFLLIANDLSSHSAYILNYPAFNLTFQT